MLILINDTIVNLNKISYVEKHNGNQKEDKLIKVIMTNKSAYYFNISLDEIQKVMEKHVWGCIRLGDYIFTLDEIASIEKYDEEIILMLNDKQFHIKENFDIVWNKISKMDEY